MSLEASRVEAYSVFSLGGSLVRAMLAVLLTCLFAGCISAAREREVYCLAATITDLWQTEHELTSAEQVWRTALYAPAERSAPSRDSSPFSIRVADASSPPGQPAALLQSVPFLSSRSEGDETVFRHLVDARGRHREASKWYGVVARRVQTRIEEDEMLYPVLSMLATSAAIVVYPLVRWNVRSVLWDGADPDADDDPVQQFCAARLEPRP
jgi:hypothetical protein